MSLKKRIADLGFKKLSGVSIYLFGSALYNDTSSTDIDLAIVYDKSVVPIQEIISYRVYVKNKVAEELNYKSDILLLSKEEEAEAKFLSNAKHYQII